MVLLLCFFQLFKEELHIVRQVWPFSLESAAYEENGISTVGLVHVFEELPSHAAGGNGEYGAEVGHFSLVPSQMLVQISREKEKRPPKLVK